MEHFYQVIPGWFDFEDVYREAVAAAPSDRRSRFVELGSYYGRSSAYMAAEIANSGKPIDFVCVDVWETPERATAKFADDPTASYADFCGAMDRFILRREGPGSPIWNIGQGTLTAQHMDSQRAAKYLSDVDFCFIDADHTYEMVKADIEAWLPRMLTGGVIAGHDYGAQFPDVGRAVHELFGDRPRITGRSWVVQL